MFAVRLLFLIDGRKEKSTISLVVSTGVIRFATAVIHSFVLLFLFAYPAPLSSMSGRQPSIRFFCFVCFFAAPSRTVTTHGLLMIIFPSFHPSSSACHSSVSISGLLVRCRRPESSPAVARHPIRRETLRCHRD